MSFYSIKYNYDPSKLIEGMDNVFEIGGYTYFIGRLFNDDEIDKQSLFISKRDINGSIIWEKQYFVGEYRFVSASLDRRLFQLDNGDLSLFFWNDNMLLSMNIDVEGNLLATKKYYDKADTPAMGNLRVTFTIAEQTSNGNIFVAINENHSESFVIVKNQIKFLKIQPSTGNVLLAKQYEETNQVISLNSAISSENKIICVGDFGQSDSRQLCVISLNNNLEILDTFKFDFVYPSPAYFSKETQAISNVINNKVYILATSSLSASPVIHLIELGINKFGILRSSTFSVQSWVTSTSNDDSISHDSEAIHVTDGLHVYKFSTASLQSIWGKKVQYPFSNSIGNSYNVHNIGQDVIYLDKRNRVFADGQAVDNSHAVFRSNKELETCNTGSLDMPQIISCPVSMTPIQISFQNNEAITYPSINIEVIGDLNVILEELCPPIGGDEYDLERSTITANPNTINADGVDISLITVQLKDGSGNNITTGGESVIISESAGNLTATVDNNNGTYTANLTSQNPGSALLSFTVNSNLAIATTGVKFVKKSTGIPITEITLFQSPNFYLQSVGSLGVESTKGIHLRWIFGGTLGEKHLPKRDYAENTNNFNKPNDVVSVYRAPYRKFQFSLNLFESPLQVNDANKFWVYQFANDREFHVYFRNTSKYNQVRSSINPLLNPSGFIQSYGDELIEIENKTELFFAAELKAVNNSPGSLIQTESLSVSENIELGIKTVSSRKTFTSSELNEVRLVCENGRSIRFKTANCQVSEIYFEFYGDFIASANKDRSWSSMGDYGLTTEDNTAYSLLEPNAGLVDKHWQRFNDNAYVKIENYQKKWNRDTEPWDRDIKQIVENYIHLSNSATNPTATETVPFSDDDNDPIEISNLDQLNFAAYDYHIARMLGLGFLDVDNTVFDSKYIYIAEYTTFGDLEDGLGKREVHHLSMGLPTSINDERLPLPVNLEEIIPGAFFGNEGEPVNLTSEDGYTHGGESRYVTLYAENLPSDLIGVLFYQTTEEFSLDQFTYPIYSGVEYEHSNTEIPEPTPHVWQKPELSNDLEYQNAVPAGEAEHNETRVLQVPENNVPFYVHKQNRNGFHYYSSYGINWFSRSTSSEEVLEIETQLQPKNDLLPPSNISPLLIRRESPLFLTSAQEQQRLNEIDPNPNDDISADETLIRITFDYHSSQDMINRTVPLDLPYSNNEIVADVNNPDILYPNNQEVFANEIDIFFRGQLPNNISGKALPLSQTPQPSNTLLSNIQAVNYEVASTGGTITPILSPGSEENYSGGVFIIGDQQHIIHSVVQGIEGPIFSIYKKEISDAIVNDIPSADADNLQPIEISDDGLFMAVENMQNASSWGTPNPLPLTVKINNQWGIQREIIQTYDDEGNIERHVEKSRGIWSDNDFGNAKIEKELEPKEQYNTNGELIVDANGYPVTVDVHRGLYKITFNNIQLSQHEQYNSEGVSVEWFRGIARVFTVDSFDSGIPNKTRKVLPVIRIENIDSSSDLVIYVNDPTFPEQNEDNDPNNNIGYDYIQIGNNISVNFYPGYKVYLYNDDAYGLNEDVILPNQGEGTRNSIFGLRSRDLELQQYSSKISVPSLMFAQEMIQPEIPKQPQGTLYATRPDFFGRSTYTITTEYEHQPHGVLFYRANDEALLNALYSKDTVKFIREQLKVLEGNDEAWFTDRWQNFLDFSALENGDYEEYPPESEEIDFRFKFPNPDKLGLFEWANEIITRINENQAFVQNPLLDLFNVNLNDSNNDLGAFSVGDPRIFGFVKGAIYNAFVPLTKVPIIYQHIELSDYTPVNEKQVVRDKNGYVLSPADEEFKMAPMMKRISNAPHQTQFVDFNLDGTSNNIYFYGVRELGSQMKMGDYSPFLGPIKLVNTNPPETPEVKRIMPVLENQILGIDPKIQLEINAYPEVQNIKKLTIHRAFNKLDAQSVRTMQVVKIIDLEEEGIISNSVWKVNDTFEDLQEVPYGEGLFYRITVSRKVEYADKNGNVVIEYQPSQVSKIVASMMVESANPVSPILSFTSDPLPEEDITEVNNIVLQWNKTCYNGKYYIYKMNSQGNWVKIYEIRSNSNTIALPLVDTNLGSGTLQVRNEDNNTIYHHFKAIAENSSGMLSTEEYILTILQNIIEDENIVSEPTFSSSSGSSGIGFNLIEAWANARVLNPFTNGYMGVSFSYMNIMVFNSLLYLEVSCSGLASTANSDIIVTFNSSVQQLTVEKSFVLKNGNIILSLDSPIESTSQIISVSIKSTVYTPSSSNILLTSGSVDFK